MGTLTNVRASFRQCRGGVPAIRKAFLLFLIGIASIADAFIKGTSVFSAGRHHLLVPPARRLSPAAASGVSVFVCRFGISFRNTSLVE